MNGATGGAAVLLLLLFYGRVAFTAARSLNAPRDRAVQPLDGQKDGTDSLTAAVTGVDRRRASPCWTRLVLSSWWGGRGGASLKLCRSDTPNLKS
ncbi:hypothetical protein PFLUV_G00091460 [Perca fluviatilis]|uniref:Secreted protein n=1 Tax=Perca fluviatilis TaxID=8168 RepID=A0A6A5FIT6_PERFL|nr:hypothetical protein PFLUV_G00091460 [Perca fluviatilis]